MPADRAGVRTFREQFSDCGLEVALEATTGWRFVVEEPEAIGAEAHLAEPAEAAALNDNQQSVLAFRLAAAQPAIDRARRSDHAPAIGATQQSRRTS